MRSILAVIGAASFCVACGCVSLMLIQSAIEFSIGGEGTGFRLGVSVASTVACVVAFNILWRVG